MSLRAKRGNLIPRHVSRRSLRRLWLLAMTLFAVWACPPVRAEEQISEIQARFGEMSGDVQLLSQGAVDWIDAHTDLPLQSGDQIRVGDDGEAVLVMSDHALWTLRANSEAAIGYTTSTEGRLSLRTGTLLGKVLPQNGLSQEWRFETPTAVCAVRGTEFVIAHDDEEGTHLGVFEGVVEMGAAESAAGEGTLVMIRANEEGLLRHGQALRKLNQHSFWIRQQQHRLPLLRQRLQRVRDTWSPFTPSYRNELRRKFIVTPKVKPHRPPVRRARRKPGKSDGAF